MAQDQATRLEMTVQSASSNGPDTAPELFTQFRENQQRTANIINRASKVLEAWQEVGRACEVTVLATASLRTLPPLHACVRGQAEGPLSVGRLG